MSTDGGSVWDEISLPAGWTMYEENCAMAIDPNQPETILLGGTGYTATGNLNICRSTDQGVNWEVVYDPGSCRIEYIHADLSIPGHFLAGGHTTNIPYTPVLLESWDSGETWADLSWAGMDGLVYTLEPIQGTGNILCGTSTGIFLRENAKDWFKVSDHPAREVIPDVHREGHYYAACQLDGVYSSTDWGLTWNLLGEVSPGGEPWKVMSVERVSSDWLYAGTYCRGVYRYDLEPLSIEGPDRVYIPCSIRAAQNPSIGTVTLYVDNLDSMAVLSVYDISGRRVCTSELQAGSDSVATVLTDLPAGVYMAKLNSSDQACRFVIVR